MEVPGELPELVHKRFESAKNSGDLNFYPTQLAILPCGVRKLPFQVRFSPSLANKPKPSKHKDTQKPFDPFLDPPEALLVCELPPSHIIVLNKFAIVPEHFILATKEFREQTCLLDEGDLTAAYMCIEAYQNHGGLFAFFNSGEHSGASQPHRHIQFLPIRSMISDVEVESWQPLVNSLAAVGLTPESELPFAYFASALPESPSPPELHRIYMSLYERCCTAVQQYISSHPDSNLHLHDFKDGASSISYNIGLTDKVMVLCPRISDGKSIISGDGNMIGPIALNGTVLAGTLLVKTESEWNALRDDGSKLMDLLGAIGVPPVPQQHDGKL